VLSSASDNTGILRKMVPVTRTNSGYIVSEKYGVTLGLLARGTHNVPSLLKNPTDEFTYK